MPVAKKFNTTSQLKKVTLLFDKKGYEATSMQDIVDVTGLNRSSIYNSFGSKLDLFLACFNSCERNYKKEIQKIILLNLRPLKTLSSIYELFIKKDLNGYLIPNYASELKNEEKEIQKLIQNQYDYLEGLFSNIVKRGQSLGTINNSKSVNQYTLLLLNTYFGLSFTSRTTSDKNILSNIIYNSLIILE